jgi:hypothetical protein
MLLELAPATKTARVALRRCSAALLAVSERPEHRSVPALPTYGALKTAVSRVISSSPVGKGADAPLSTAPCFVSSV